MIKFSKKSKTKPAEAGAVLLEFVKPGARSVAVAGSFNAWNPERAPMVSLGNGRWVKELAVGPGRYEYLFVADGDWLPDPTAKESAQNPYGGTNSVIVITA